MEAAAIPAFVEAGEAGAGGAAAGGAAKGAAKGPTKPAAKVQDKAAVPTRGQSRQRRSGPFRGGNQVTRITTVTIVLLFGTGLLRSILIDNRTPSRKWWVGTLTASAFLSILGDLFPTKTTKYFMYAVIVGITYNNIGPLAEAIQKGKLDTAASIRERQSGTPGQSTTTAAEFGSTAPVRPDLVPVFLRGQDPALTRQAMPVPRRSRRPRTTIA